MNDGNEDADHDGLNNAREDDVGTSPVDGDSDNDHDGVMNQNDASDDDGNADDENGANVCEHHGGEGPGHDSND